MDRAALPRSWRFIPSEFRRLAVSSPKTFSPRQWCWLATRRAWTGRSPVDRETATLPQEGDEGLDEPRAEPQLSRQLQIAAFAPARVFVSSNTNDFAASPTSSTVHPDIQGEFAAAGLEYFTSWRAALGSLRAQGATPVGRHGPPDVQLPRACQELVSGHHARVGEDRGFCDPCFGLIAPSHLGPIEFGVVGPRRYTFSENKPPDRPEREPRRRENMKSQLPRSVSAFHR